MPQDDTGFFFCLTCFCVCFFSFSLFFSCLKGFADARIEGWLPKEESDFVDERGQPAALWHIEYDDQGIGGIASTLPAVKHVVKHVKHAY